MCVCVLGFEVLEGDKSEVISFDQSRANTNNRRRDK